MVRLAITAGTGDSNACYVAFEPNAPALQTCLQTCLRAYSAYIGHLTAWNKALRTTKLGLGKLSLCSHDDGDVYVTMYRGAGSEKDGALLLPWLPRQHHCICEVRVHDRTRFNWLSFMSSVIVGRAPNLQSVVFHPRCSLQPASEFLQAFGPPKCLCILDLTNVRISDVLAPKVADVLTGNGPTFHSVKLVGNQLSPETAGSLIFLCERLEDLTFQDNGKSSSA